MTTEAARALAYRQRMQTLEKLRLQRERALAGNPAELAQLKADWAALLPPYEVWDETPLVDEDERVIVT